MNNTDYKAYISWNNMISRCLNPSTPCYEHYGGRGITVCKEWLKFENFLSDMGERPIGLSLDRIDNSRGYYPRNCRWINQREQTNNTRKNRLFIAKGPNGEEELAKNQSRFARKYNLSVKSINYCLRGKQKQYKGWEFIYIPKDFPRYKELTELFNQ